MRRVVLGVLVASVWVLCTFASTASAEGSVPVQVQTVNQAQKVYGECLEAGTVGEYATALWLHDWVIYNADFDTTYTYYGPEGILLYGRGVCQSYALAYKLLLDCAGIENRLVTSIEDMDHAWNLVRINGSWCHVDSCWDDPIGGGGETHVYFGISDELMRRDHQWTQGDLPEASGLENFYPVLNGQACVGDRDSMIDALNAAAEQKNEEIYILYTGSDGSFSVKSVLEEWFAAYNWKYGLAGYNISVYGYGIRISMRYTAPWQKPADIDPVQSPSFVLETPEGQYSSESLLGNGLVLILGSAADRNTTNLLDMLNGSVAGLNDAGVAVIVGMDGASSAADLSFIASQYSAFKYAYGTSVLWSMLDAVGFDTTGSVIYPVVFVLNGSGQIIHYSVGPVAQADKLISTAYTVATGNPIPEPLQPTHGGKCNVPLSSVKGTTAKQLRQLSREEETVLFLYDYAIYQEELAQMKHYEQHYEAYQKMHIRLVVCAFSLADIIRYRSAYPHVDFLTDDGVVLWSMLNAVGWKRYTETDYMSSYLIRNGFIVDYTNGSQITCSSLLGETAFELSLSSPLPAFLTEIEEQAFEGTAFTTIDFTASNVQHISSEAFLNCTSLQIVKIPSGIVVDDGAFSGCPNLMILCEFGSSAYYYAMNNNIPCLTRY